MTAVPRDRDDHARRRELARLRSTRSRLGNRLSWACRAVDAAEARIAALTAEIALLDRQEAELLAAGEAET